MSQALLQKLFVLQIKCLQTRLVVPQFVVEDGTEELFWNLMALEQCHYPFEAYKCNYILLLDCLINSEEDVELLVDKRIIVNLLGSSEAVARMVNNLCLEIIETKSCYRHIADDLNKLYDSPWNQNISLRNVHFWDVWRGTASVVGVLVLVITIFNFPRPFVFKNTWISSLWYFHICWKFGIVVVVFEIVIMLGL